MNVSKLIGISRKKVPELRPSRLIPKENSLHRNIAAIELRTLREIGKNFTLQEKIHKNLMGNPTIEIAIMPALTKLNAILKPFMKKNPKGLG